MRNTRQKRQYRESGLDLSRLAVIERSKMLRTCSNVRFGEVASQHRDACVNGSFGPGTFPMLSFAQDFARFTNCALLPLVWRMAKVCYPLNLSMVQRMLRQTSRTAMG
jgi:hypothetical protein